MKRWLLLPALVLGALSVRWELNARKPVKWQSPAAPSQPAPAQPSHDEWQAALRSASWHEWQEMEQNALRAIP